MNRLTKSLDNKQFYVDDTKVTHDVNGYFGEAIDRLAKFENFYDALVSQQEEITRELDKLRSEGKTTSVKFKQLFANKLTNNNILILLKTYGIGIE